MRSKRQMMRGKGKRRGDAGSIVLLSWLIPVTPVRSLPLREGRGVGFPVFLSGCSGGGGATLPTTPTQGPRKDRQRRSVPLLPSLPLSSSVCASSVLCALNDAGLRTSSDDRAFALPQQQVG